MSNGPTDDLKPTLWRTCRVLANRTRLNILRSLFNKPGQSVENVAGVFSIGMPLASRYLRDLNARGLLKARRVGRRVCYWPYADESMRQARALFEALWITMSREKRPVDFVFHKATAFTHPRRIAIVKELAGRPMRLCEIQRRASISAPAAKRHLRKLVDRGFVRRDEHHAVYALTKPASAFECTLLTLASEA
jgi:DNA-binding transcriptional ArsR family regulator